MPEPSVEQSDIAPPPACNQCMCFSCLTSRPSIRRLALEVTAAALWVRTAVPLRNPNCYQGWCPDGMPARCRRASGCPRALQSARAEHGRVGLQCTYRLVVSFRRGVSDARCSAHHGVGFYFGRGPPLVLFLLLHTPRSSLQTIRHSPLCTSHPPPLAALLRLRRGMRGCQARALYL